MLQKIKESYYSTGAFFTIGMLATSSQSHAANNFNTISQNIVGSIQDLPGLLSAISYLVGVLLGTLGIMKIKDHVENPSQTPIKDGAIRLAAGGALFALPIIFEAMSETVDQGGAGAGASVAQLQGVGFAASLPP